MFEFANALPGQHTYPVPRYYLEQHRYAVLGCTPGADGLD